MPNVQTVCEVACISELHFESITSELGIFFVIQLNQFLCCHDEKMAVADRVADQVP